MFNVSFTFPIVTFYIKDPKCKHFETLKHFFASQNNLKAKLQFFGSFGWNGPLVEEVKKDVSQFNK